MKRFHVIFFLIFVLSSVSVPQVFANHYTDLGIDDTWYWRVYDMDSHDISCLYISGADSGDFLSDDGVDNIQFIANDDGTDRSGYCLFIKTFNIADIQNVGGSNTFNLRYESYSDSTPYYIGMSVLDGNYQQYYDYSDPTIFPDDYVLVSSNYEMGNIPSGTWGNLEATSSGKKDSLSCAFSYTAGTQTITCTIDNTEWGRALTSQVSVMFWMGRDSGLTDGNFRFQPESFWITSTPNGTLTWNWPETAEELSNWDLYSYHLLELNGTKHDYGYFITYDESVPDPPTNLIAVLNAGNMNLDWEAPIFNGYDPIIGYKIERESPIGGGFSTIVPNTGSTDTEYIDTTINANNEYNYRVRAINSHGESVPSNESKDGVISSTSDPEIPVTCDQNPSVFGLFVPIIGITDATLCWNGGILNQTDLLGYQINYTTPWGDPLTISNNNTASNATTATLTPLSPATQYSVRVKSWMNTTSSNYTNIANFTTASAQLDIGDLIIPSDSNPFRFDWIFTREELSANNVALLVEYPDSFNATCTFNMKFARTNQTFSNISTVPSDELADRQIANFTLQGYNNDLIMVDCIDENTNSTGRYIIYQDDYPLKEQIENFRNGTYGTSGDFGFFDLFTLAAVFFAMIGFNRVNPAVGAVFAIAILGVATWLGFITNIFISITAGITVFLVTIAILVHNRNDVAN